MPAGSIDRRIARTRSLLQEALFKLTADKGYAAVTVEEICREADVGRSTFYTHYPDKDCLRKATIDEHIRAMNARADVQNSPPNARGFAFSGPAFRHALAAREMHRSLISGKKREMPEEIHDWINGQVRRELASFGVEGSALEVTTRFVVGAFTEITRWWLDEKTNLSPADVDQLFQRLAFEGVGTALAAPHEANGKSND